MEVDTTELEKAFDHWLAEKPVRKFNRLDYWLAWKADAEWALAEMKAELARQESTRG
jgi:hypothetical protein